MTSPWIGTGAKAKADYLARQGLAVPSIHRMVKYEFGNCPPEKQLAEMVEAEAKRRARFKRGASC